MLPLCICQPNAKDPSNLSVAVVKIVLSGTILRLQDSNTTYTVKCNIDETVTYLHQGIKLGLTEDREKNSEKLERLALFKGTAQIAGLPPYLTVQMVRFFYKVSVQQKAKILKKVCVGVCSCSKQIAGYITNACYHLCCGGMMLNNRCSSDQQLVHDSCS